MLTPLLSIRALFDRALHAARESLHSAPTLDETIRALRAQIGEIFARLLLSMRLTTFSSIYSAVARLFVKLARLCIEALDWLLLPRMAWKITVRHCVALLVLYFVKVLWNLALVPVIRGCVSMLRPLFINAEYLSQEAVLKGRMANAKTFLEWKKSASELDRLQGKYHWKESSQSLHYDWRRIRDDLQRFRELVDSNDVRGIMAFSRSRLLRNLVGINDRRLYAHLRAGTKRLIEEYISEVVRALQLVCVTDSGTTVTTGNLAAVQQEGDGGNGGGSDDDADAEPDEYPVDPPTTAEKLSFFNETRHAFGRSALLLSGGATLGLYHIGVMKALHDSNLLPRVISGSSVGSIICAMVGTRTDDELHDLFDPDGNSIKLNFFPPNGGSVKRKITRLFTQGVLMDIKILKKCVKANVPPLTFQEAYELSGRIINIVVSPASGSGNQDTLRLLNYLTAPNVLVWSAALASCAIPGIYAPVELMKKDEKTGKLSPYMEGGGAPIKWEDGSVQADLPMQRLSELFNINHFIVSQCLINGTKVRMADGSARCCESVKQGDRLLGHRGEIVVAGPVQASMPRDTVWRIVHDDGSEYTVSSEHRVTIRCNLSPQLSIIQCSSERFQVQLSFVSAIVEWTRISWEVAVGPEGVTAVEQTSDTLEANESQPLLSGDGELLLLQSAEDDEIHSPRHITSLHVTPGSSHLDEQLRSLAISKLNELGRPAYLVRGQLAELSVVELYDRREALRWSCGGDQIDRVTGFKAVLPSKMDAENLETLGWTSQNDPCGSTLIALGEGSYDAFMPNADAATIVYQLPTPSAADAAHNTSASRPFILRRIEALQQAMGIALDRAADIIHTELTPAFDSDEDCTRSIDNALSLNTASIVAFGSIARHCWTAALRRRAASGEFTNFSDSFERAVRCLRFTRWIADGSSSPCRELVTTVWLAPHPCDWHLSAVTSYAIALAHGREPLKHVESQCVWITSIDKRTRDPNSTPFLVTNISIDAKREEDKRYVLENGVVTHNCNPHVVPFISSASSTHTLQQSFLMNPLSKLLDYLLSQLKSTALNFLHLNIIPIHPSVKYVLDQKYLGDITLVPDVSPMDYTQLLVNPTSERLRTCILQSENSTWRLIPTIRGACEIEFSLDECVRRMRGTLILEELSDVRRFSRHMSRVRSWSSDLLAVGQHASHSIPGGDSLAPACEPCTTQETMPRQMLSSRTRSEHNLLGSALQRAQTERMSAAHVADLGKWNNKFERPPLVKRSSTAAAIVGPGSLAARNARLGAPRRTSALDAEHEAEDDDVVSEEEEQDAALRRQQEQWEVGARSDPDADLADEDQGSQHEGQIDDEGITRQRMPLHTPDSEGRPTPIAQLPAEAPTAAAAAAEPPQKDVMVAAAGPASAVPQLSPERPARAPALRSGRKGAAKRVNIFSPDATPPAAAAATATPEWSGDAAVAPVEPILLPAPSLFTPPPPAPTSSDGLGAPGAAAAAAAAPAPASGTPTTDATRLQQPSQSPQTSQPGSFASLPPVSRRRGETDRAISAAVGSSAPGGLRRPASRPRTPDPISSTDPTLSRQEWQEEKHNPVLSQLLKTTQTRVLTQPSGYKRNTSANRATAAGGAGAGAGSSDVSLHIPSLVMFRHTPPRRMSAMDLKLLDDGSAGAAGGDDAVAARPLPRIASHHHHTFHAQQQRPLHQTHHESSDSEDELAQQASSSRRDSLAPETGSLSMWLTRASSFFGGSSTPASSSTAADAAVPTHGRATSAASTGSVEPLSDSDDDGSTTHTPASPPQHARYPPLRSSLAQQQLPASSSAFAPRSQTLPLNSDRRGSSGSPRIRAAASPATAVRYASSSSSASTVGGAAASSSGVGGSTAASSNGIAAAVRSGLPRTLSQLELISDVSTMP